MPPSPVDGNLVEWGSTNNRIEDSGLATTSVVTLTGSQVLTNKTLTTPTIADMTNAVHDHEDNAGGGQLHASNVFWIGEVPLARGGTDADLSATGGANQIVRQNSAGGGFTVSVLAAADIPSLDAAKITTGTLDLARVASGSAGNRMALTAYTGDTVATLRQMGGYEFTPFTIIGADAANMTISSIPTTFNKMVLLIIARTDRAGQTNDGVLTRPNNNTTAANYVGNQFFLRATSANVENLGATANLFPSITATAATAPAGYFGEVIVTIPNYASSANNRHYHFAGYLPLADTTGAMQHIVGGGTFKDATNPITSVTIVPQNGTNFKAGSGYALWLF